MARQPEVDIECGRLRGLQDERGLAFLGIPYADDTAGPNRFLEPRPAPSWTGVRDAFSHGPRCPQTDEDVASRPAFAWYRQPPGVGEACCVLNVFTPDLRAEARRPVLFYVHGGGYASGGGGGAVLDGRSLAAAEDLVVVTVNHRLNVFGYTELEPAGDGPFAAATHAGQLDLIAALRWVARHAPVFGGDPDNVTAMGQSGGGNKVMTLLTMPRARGLFRRAINLGGASGLRTAAAGDPQPYVRALLEHLDIRRGDWHRLQQVPAHSLRSARQAAMTKARIDGAHPVVDGREVLAGPFTPQGLALQADIPLLLGTTDSEATLFLGRHPSEFAVDAAELHARLQAQFQLDDAAVLTLVEAYRSDEPGSSPTDVLVQVTSDVLARGRLIGAAEAKARAGAAPVWMYGFAWCVPVEGGGWRSPHTADIPFAFGTLDAARCMTGDDPHRLAEAESTSRSLMAAIGSFARSGDPNNARMPAWPAYEPARRATMIVAPTCRVVEDPRPAGRIASARLLGRPPAELLRGPLLRGCRTA